MGGGEAGGLPHEIPDWKIYKAEGIPELDLHQKRLSAVGLKDPWIRNEAWRYMEGTTGNFSPTMRMLRMAFRGLPLATGALVLTIAYDKLTSKPRQHGGHH